MMRRAGSARPEAIRRRAPARGLAHRLVGEADDDEGRQPGRDLHLDVDGARLDAFERHRDDALRPSLSPKPHPTLAERSRQSKNKIGTIPGKNIQENRMVNGILIAASISRSDLRLSIRSHSAAAASAPPKRLSARMPVGEVTLISVR